MNDSSNYYRSNHTVYKCIYHIIFCPKYRRKILIGDIKLRLEEVIHLFAKKKKFEIIEMEIMPDHVHLLLSIYPDYAPLELVKQLKYFTAHNLRKEFPEIDRKLPNLWTRSCFISTVGGAPLDIIKQYIENQKNK